MTEVVYKRVLLKLSGEALMGSYSYGIDPQVMKRIAEDIQALVELKVQVAVVIGAGNIFRGAGLAEAGMDRVAGDHMGMLGTVINSLALQDAMECIAVPSRVMSAIPIDKVCEEYIRRRALRHLEKKRVTIFAAGTGNPFFTTDSAAALRAIEINANLMLKATKVDGVYDSDPMKNTDAKRFSEISYDEVIALKLGVMDTTAMVMCRDHKMPIRVFNMNEVGALIGIVKGEDIGTTVN